MAAGDIPYPDGYQAIRAYVQHVHFKDLICDTNGDYRYSVYGQIDWAGQIQALANDGYDGHISVEPHMQPKVASAKATYARLKTLVEATSQAAST
jgi:sugar phosphate isomerase/epimerase